MCQLASYFLFIYLFFDPGEPLDQFHAFPDFKTIESALALNRTVRMQAESYCAWCRTKPQTIMYEELMADLRWRNDTWELLRFCKWDPKDLLQINILRARLGDEAFFAGTMPYPIP